MEGSGPEQSPKTFPSPKEKSFWRPLRAPERREWLFLDKAGFGGGNSGTTAPLRFKYS